MEYIKRQIEATDYFVLMIGARYGSEDEETGKSFTQLIVLRPKLGCPYYFFRWHRLRAQIKPPLMLILRRRRA